MLKKNLDKDKEIHKQDNLRIMKENVNLIREINQLRKKIRDIKYPQKGNEQQEKKISTRLKNLIQNSILKRMKIKAMLKLRKY